MTTSTRNTTTIQVRVPDATRRRARANAALAGVTLGRYIAGLIEGDSRTPGNVDGGARGADLRDDEGTA